MSIKRIYCKNISPVWQNESPTLLKDTNIWKIKVLKNYADTGNILNKDEQVKSLRFRHAKNRDSFICRRTALRILLSRYTNLPANEIEFISGNNKKPELKNYPKLCFNVSHSEDLILIAISQTAVGIDIEHIKPEFNFTEVLNHSFSEKEIKFINNSKEQTDCFFELWTRKEALTKASSKGLDNDLKNIPSLEGWHNIDKEIIRLDGNWQLNSFHINHDYAASIACTADQNLNFYDFKF